MKKLILASAAILISLASFAQTDSTNDKMMDHKMGTGMNHDKMDMSQCTGVAMVNGKMMMEHNGEMQMMDQDMTMKNGTKVMTDGTCIKKDGTKMMLKEGQHMKISGEMVPMKKEMKEEMKKK